MSHHLQLSADQFRHIRRHLKWVNNTSDKRHSPRVGVRNSVVMRLMGPKGQMAPPREVPVRNISRDGIGVLFENRLPLGSRFVIQFPIEGEKELIAVYETKHCETLDERLFGIGGRLLAFGDPQEEQKPALQPTQEAAPNGPPAGNPNAKAAMAK